MTFWASQLFHLAVHLVMVATLYFALIKLPAMLRAPLKGKPKQIEDEFVRIWHTFKDKNISEMQIEFRVPETVNFTLRIETWFDRLAKRIGLIRELQLEQANFDEVMFLQTPGSLSAMAQSDPKALHWISGLHSRLGGMGVRFRQLQASDGRMKLSLLVYPPRRDVDQIEQTCVQWLKTPLLALRSLSAQQYAPSAWPLLQRQLGWLFLLVSLSFLGWFHLGSEHLQQLGTINLMALIPAVVLVLLWFAWLERRFDLSAVRHRVLLLLLLAGGPMVWAESAFVLRQVNIVFDFRAPTFVPLETAQVQRFSRRKSQDLLCIFYRTRADDVSGRLSIGPMRFQQLSQRWPGGESNDAVLVEHPGALGIPWLEIISAE